MIRRFLLFLALSLLPLPAQAVPIVADISNYHIEIDTSFNGIRLFLFGARNDSGDVVVVVRGPSKNYMVRKKEEMAGIWVNTDRMKFYNVPAFYIVAASKKLSEVQDKGIMRQLGIGQENLLTPANIKKMPQFAEFSQAFLDHQYIRTLYAKDEGLVEFMGETLFKTTVDFPDDIPPGNYIAEIYLLSDGEIQGMQAIPILVSKTGLDAFLYEAAHRYPAFYGLAAIGVALMAGYIAGRLFQR